MQGAVKCERSTLEVIRAHHTLCMILRVRVTDCHDRHMARASVSGQFSGLLVIFPSTLLDRPAVS